MKNTMQLTCQWPSQCQWSSLPTRKTCFCEETEESRKFKQAKEVLTRLKKADNNRYKTTLVKTSWRAYQNRIFLSRFHRLSKIRVTNHHFIWFIMKDYQSWLYQVKVKIAQCLSDLTEVRRIMKRKSCTILLLKSILTSALRNHNCKPLKRL